MNKDSVKTFLDYFDEIEDPRSEKSKLYSVNEIFLVVICGLMCGTESWRDFVIFGALEPEQFKECFVAWVNSLELIKNEVIAIDGKRLCKSFDKANEKSAIHMVSAFAAEARLVLAQQKVDDKSNEITAIPKLLKLLELKGNIISIDAMGTQKEIAEEIIEREGDYILALKGNHATLHDDVIEYFNDNIGQPSSYMKTIEEVDCGHGRIEVRKCYVTEEVNWLGKLKFPGMKSIICIDSERTIGEVISQERRFYISSLLADASKINSAIRGHWSIENCLHWSLDVTFNEDNSRIRSKNAAENIAMARHTALNLLQHEKAKFTNISLKALRKKAGWGNATLAAILEQ